MMHNRAKVLVPDAKTHSLPPVVTENFLMPATPHLGCEQSRTTTLLGLVREES